MNNTGMDIKKIIRIFATNCRDKCDYLKGISADELANELIEKYAYSSLSLEQLYQLLNADLLERKRIF